MGESLKIEHLSYTYHSLVGETPVLNDVSFHVMEGEFVAIVGPEGCGKSTLLSMIAGLLSPDSGFIYMNGKDIKSSGENIGYMPQKDQLRYVQINEGVNTFGLISFINSYPSGQSGCIRQRAALIRSLLLEPDILLLDEPFSDLDSDVRLQVADDIWSILCEEKKTVLLISNDISEAISLADRVIVLSPRPGSIKNIFEIHLSTEDSSPSAARNAPEFEGYYQQIKDELGV